MEFIRHVGCIQFDPINVVGRNPDLVLQARIANYHPRLLKSLLYEDRSLSDGWDKMASIYAIEDWPHFIRHRTQMGSWHRQSERGHLAAIDEMMAALSARGPLSSLEFKKSAVIDWAWGRPASIARAALEALFEMGKVGISHRTGSRRYYDLIERLVPSEILNQPEPNQSQDAYQAWHVLRRIGGLGLANSRAGDYWLGILGVKSRDRRNILINLIETGEVVLVEVEGLVKETYFIRRSDLPYLERSRNQPIGPPRTAFLGPLDNFLWDRRRLKDLFDFEYIWEVYKPVKERKFGYYVLPVLYGDGLIARVEFAYDQKERSLTLVNWWWESNLPLDMGLDGSLAAGMRDFASYLQARSFQVGTIGQSRSMSWLSAEDVLE